MEDLDSRTQEASALTGPGSDANFARYVEITRAAALGVVGGLVAAWSVLRTETERHIRVLHRHGVAGLVAQTLAADAPDLSEASEIGHVLTRIRRYPPIPAEVLLEAFVEAQTSFERAGIPALLLKGAVLAQRLYGGLDRRPQYDLDVLVPARARRAAERRLTELGYRRTRRDPHAVTLRRGQVAIDLHWALRDAPAYNLDEVGIWRDAVAVEVGGLCAQTLSDNDLLMLLSISATEDAGWGILKLKQLCDLWLLIRDLGDTVDWEAWRAARRADGTEPVASAGLALARRIMDHPRSEREPGEDPLWLIASPIDHNRNMAWFARLYPASVLRYRLSAFAANFPHSLRDVRVTRYLPRFAST